MCEGRGGQQGWGGVDLPPSGVYGGRVNEQILGGLSVGWRVWAAGLGGEVVERTWLG